MKASLKSDELPSVVVYVCIERDLQLTKKEKNNLEQHIKEVLPAKGERVRTIPHSGKEEGSYCMHQYNTTYTY